MTDYATMLRDQVTVSIQGIDRIFPAGLPASTPIAWAGRLVPKAAGFSIPLLRGSGADLHRHER